MRTLLLLSSVIFFFSCNKELTDKQIILKNIENHFKKDMHDPSSFELVEMSIADTMINYAHYEERLIVWNKTLSSGEATVADYQDLELRYKAINRSNEVNDIKIMIKDLNTELDIAKDYVTKYKDSLNAEDSGKIKYIIVDYKVRAKNMMGNKILSNYKVYLNDSLNIVEVRLK